LGSPPYYRAGGLLAASIMRNARAVDEEPVSDRLKKMVNLRWLPVERAPKSMTTAEDSLESVDIKLNEITRDLPVSGYPMI
jgi:hypothetical protein